MSTRNNNDDHCGDSGEMKSSSKECTSCEQTDVNNITEGIDSMAVLNNISCANCGKEGSDVNNICNKCKQVKYCNAACKKKHRHKHKKDCGKWVAELHEEALFKQPPPKEDCPICFLRMPTLSTGSKYMLCRGKFICSGCMHAPLYDNQGNEVDNEKCPFCRTPLPKSNEEIIARSKKRVEANDPIAFRNMGYDYRDGLGGYPQDHTKALELWHRAGELGYVAAYHNIGNAYCYGRVVEVHKQKAKRYYELAAMGGNETARHNLGLVEEDSGNMERAVKHHMIAVKDGDNDSLKYIKQLYSNGHATKEDYKTALQLYQEYLGEIKSKQRDEAAAARQEYRYY